MAGEKESIDKIIAEHSAGSLSYKDAGTTSQNNSAITIDSLPNALGIVKKDAYHQMAGEHARNAPLDKSEFSLHGKWNRTVRNSFSGEGGGNKKEIANCAPRVLASKNEASVPPGKEFAISIPNIQKELGIVKKGVNRKKAINEILQRSPNWPIPEEKVDNLLSAPNLANEEDFVKLKSENPTYLPDGSRQRPRRLSQCFYWQIERSHQAGRAPDAVPRHHEEGYPIRGLWGDHADRG